MNILSKPVIGFDIDDVIFHLSDKLVKYHNMEFGTNLSSKDVWSLDADQAYFITEKYKLYENMSATKIADMIKKIGNDMYVVLITSRRDKYKDVTEQELRSHNVSYDELFMNEKKSDVCEFEGVGLFLDDALHNIIDIKQNAPRTTPLLVKRPWNGDAEISRLAKKGIECSKNIQRLTESKIIRILGY